MNESIPSNMLNNYLQKVVSQNDKIKNDVNENLPSVSMKIGISGALGRHLTATRDIAAGEILFCEAPIVAAPQAGAGPTCLRCHRGLPALRGGCDKCGAPMCSSDECQNKYHSEAECRALAKLEENPWSLKTVKMVNAALTPLRTWITVEENTNILPVVLTLQSHAEEREKSAIGRFIDAAIVPLIQERLGCDIPREFIHHSCGIFDINAFRITTVDDKQGRALLPLAGMMIHDCTPNTDHWFDRDQCIVRASCFIPRGSFISNSYTNCLLGTQIRSKHLLITKLFTCTCERCKDPTELGTNLSSIKCRACKTGLMDPPRTVGHWTCRDCAATLPSEMAETIVRAGSMAAGSNDPEMAASRLEDVVRLVGLQHYGAQQLLTTTLTGIIQQNANEAATALLMDAVAASEALLAAADRLAPGLTLYRGGLVLNNLRARAALHRRGQAVEASALLPTITSRPTCAQVVAELVQLCHTIHLHHPLSEEVEQLKSYFAKAALKT